MAIRVAVLGLLVGLACGFYEYLITLADLCED